MTTAEQHLFHLANKALRVTVPGGMTRQHALAFIAKMEAKYSY